MKIKEPYKYYIQDHFLTMCYVFAIVIAINLFFGLVVIGVSGNTRSIGLFINQIIPSFQVLIGVVLVYTFAMYKVVMSIGNQFGRTRLSILISNSLAMVSVFIGIAFISSILCVTSIVKEGIIVSRYGNSITKSDLFIKEFLFIFTSLFNAYAIATFMISIWNRVKVIGKLLIFAGIPVVITMMIPKIIQSKEAINITKNLFFHLFKFYGFVFSANGFENFQYDIGILRNSVATILTITLPLLVLSYFVIRKSKFNVKK